MTLKFLLPAAVTLALATPAFAATDNYLLVNGTGGPVAVPSDQMPGYDQSGQPGVPNTGTTSTTPAPTTSTHPSNPGIPNTGAGGTAAATEVALAGSLALAIAGVALMRRYSVR